jgi:hypothetical protein
MADGVFVTVLVWLMMNVPSLSLSSLTCVLRVCFPFSSVPPPGLFGLVSDFDGSVPWRDDRAFDRDGFESDRDGRVFDFDGFELDLEGRVFHCDGFDSDRDGPRDFRAAPWQRRRVAVAVRAGAYAAAAMPSSAAG